MSLRSGLGTLPSRSTGSWMMRFLSMAVSADQLISLPSADGPLHRASTAADTPVEGGAEPLSSPLTLVSERASKLSRVELGACRSPGPLAVPILICRSESRVGRRVRCPPLRPAARDEYPICWVDQLPAPQRGSASSRARAWRCVGMMAPLSNPWSDTIHHPSSGRPPGFCSARGRVGKTRKTLPALCRHPGNFLESRALVGFHEAEPDLERRANPDEDRDHRRCQGAD